MSNQVISKWVPESPTIPGHYGATHPRTRGKIGELTEYGTHIIAEAPKFDTKEECEAWCDERNAEMKGHDLTGSFAPFEHAWG